eukprot:TRINITY_DN20494_c0_g1_i4.p1 TRINITY_DN20494_c0_g1~~TRINITY_DN20494_c0_g1_i4.p1  ORF type:complete len:298 (+),score=64.17 TRINITY_DN20494_c0_g1_i4:2588-3481(+)
MNSDVVSEPVLEEPAEKPCLEENPNQVDTSLNPWRSGVHQIRNAEEARPSQLDEPENEDNANKLRRSSRTQKPNPRYTNCALTTAWVATTDDADSVYEPVSFEEVAGILVWEEAMSEETKVLKQNETWELVPRPAGVTPISCKWVYKVKTKVDGSVERFKARLVARGFSQQFGLDYDETFSPVAKITTVRFLIAIATGKSWKLWQLDVKNAFLHGEVDREIYMEQPRGFEENSQYVCRLKKSIYGLKQAPRAWYGKIAEFLLANEYSITSSDSCLLVRTVDTRVSIVSIYVDDLIVT